MSSTSPISKAMIYACLVSSMSCQFSLATLTANELEDKIKGAKILQTGERISSQIKPPEAVIHKYRTAESTNSDNDCKIEAVLLAKVAMESDPEITKVKVRFFERNEPSRYSEVSVGAGDVKAFASGDITQKQLLSSLDLVRGFENSPAAAAKSASTVSGAKRDGNMDGLQSVVSGPLQSERNVLLDRIKSLHQKGVGTLPYTRQFLLLEDLAKSGDSSGTADALDKLSISVKDQEMALARSEQRSKASSVPSDASNSTAESRSASEDPSMKKEELKQLVYKYFQEEYGDFMPVEGPYKEERSLIAQVLVERKKHGQSTKEYVPMFKELNAYAKIGDKATLASKIINAFTYLHITPEVRADWRRNYYKHHHGGEHHSSKHHSDWQKYRR